MLQLRQNEEVVITVRQHWFVIAGKLLLSGFLLLFPFLVGGMVSSLLSSVGVHPETAIPLVNFFIATYSMVILAGILFSFMDYYLDIWIVTNQRILDIDQRGLFSREVGEIPITRVQDITTDIHGIMQSLLKFGTIRLQTAGEREYNMPNVPHLDQVKEAILRYSHPDTWPIEQQPPSSQTPEKEV